MQEPSGRTKEPKLDADSNSVAVSKRPTIVFIVTMALLLDYMLLTVIVAIIPEILYRIENNDTKLDSTTVISPTHEILTNFSNERLFRSNSLINSRSVMLKPYQNKSVKLEANILSRNMHQDKTTIDGYIAKPNEQVNSLELVHRKKLISTRKQENKVSDEGLKVGILLASKALVQLLVNPFVGYLTDRIGYKTPMVIGFSIMVISTLAFAFGSSYPFLLFARAFQGVGSSCVGVSGMAVLAQSYPEDNERGKVMGIALSGGLAGGVLIGPPFGGFMSEFVGKSSPFLVLAMLSFIGVILQTVYYLS
jgi:DHA1 family solute carrier family 18 vesicular amine transporter 1/2